MTTRPLRKDGHQRDDRDQNDGRCHRPAKSEASLCSGLVEEIADGRAERPSQNERCPEQQDARDVRPAVEPGQDHQCSPEDDRAAAIPKRSERLVDRLINPMPLRSIARLERGLGLVPRRFEILDASLKAQVAEFLPQAEAQGVDLGFEQLEPLLVRADAAALSVLVRNLLDNAIRHTPSGGRVGVSLRPQGRQALLFIEDSGPGLRPEVLSRVFEPFYRGPDPIGEGNGLGLSIVKKIADRFDGTVTLGNIPNEEGRAGLRVTVSFPLASDRPA